MYSRIEQSEFMARINALLEGHGLSAWQPSYISPDSLGEYVKSQQGKYECMGGSSVQVDEDNVRNSCPPSLIWEEVGWPLIDHAQNTPVFDAYIAMEAERVSGNFYLSFDGNLFGDNANEPTKYTDDSCIQFAPEEWCATRMAITSIYEWWLSFDSEKLVFSPDGLDVLVAFHHDCFHLATLRHEAEIRSLWKAICNRITTP